MGHILQKDQAAHWIWHRRSTALPPLALVTWSDLNDPDNQTHVRTYVKETGKIFIGWFPAHSDQLCKVTFYHIIDVDF